MLDAANYRATVLEIILTILLVSAVLFLSTAYIRTDLIFFQFFVFEQSFL